MSTVLSQSIIQGCMDALEAYANQAQGLNDQLRDLINNMIGTDYVGDGADAYQNLYRVKVAPAIEDNLIVEAGALIPKLREAFEFIRQQIIIEADGAVATANNDAAGSGS